MNVYKEVRARAKKHDPFYLMFVESNLGEKGTYIEVPELNHNILIDDITEVVYEKYSVNESGNTPILAFGYNEYLSNKRGEN